MTVEADHVYYVGQARALVHNTYCAANFRDNLERLTGINPADAGAHHVFPQALEDVFRDVYGIDIHDPVYGEWWNTEDHLANSAAYQQA